MIAIALFLAFIPISTASVSDDIGSGGSGGCGDYSVSGIIRERSGKIALVLHDGTVSEVVMNLNSTGQLNALPFLNHPVAASVKIRSESRGRSIVEMNEIRERVPDPLRDPHAKSMRLLQEYECERP